MTATTSDPRVIELACRLIEKLSAVHRETAQVDSNGRDLHVTSQTSRLSYDALVACHRLRHLVGHELSTTDDFFEGTWNDLEPLAQEFVGLVGVGADAELELAIVSIGRVVSGVTRYAELT